jgi:hypothetical protein
MANINGDDLHAVFADKSSHYGSIVRLHSVGRPRFPQQDGLDIMEMAKRGWRPAPRPKGMCTLLGTVAFKASGFVLLGTVIIKRRL